MIASEEEEIKMSNPMFNISYGLYVLTANDWQKDNGCIINTVT